MDLGCAGWGTLAFTSGALRVEVQYQATPHLLSWSRVWSALVMCLYVWLQTGSQGAPSHSRSSRSARGSCPAPDPHWLVAHACLVPWRHRACTGSAVPGARAVPCHGAHHWCSPADRTPDCPRRLGLAPSGGTTAAAARPAAAGARARTQASATSRCRCCRRDGRILRRERAGGQAAQGRHARQGHDGHAGHRQAAQGGGRDARAGRHRPLLCVRPACSALLAAWGGGARATRSCPTPHGRASPGLLLPRCLRQPTGSQPPCAPGTSQAPEALQSAAPPAGGTHTLLTRTDGTGREPGRWDQQQRTPWGSHVLLPHLLWVVRPQTPPSAVYVRALLAGEPAAQAPRLPGITSAAAEEGAHGWGIQHMRPAAQPMGPFKQPTSYARCPALLRPPLATGF